MPARQENLRTSPSSTGPVGSPCSAIARPRRAECGTGRMPWMEVCGGFFGSRLVCGGFFGSRLFAMESRSAGLRSALALQGFWRALSVVLARPTDPSALGGEASLYRPTRAGGHNFGSLPTFFALVPAAVDAVARALVLAAGGIVDGRGAAASLALGADSGGNVAGRRAEHDSSFLELGSYAGHVGEPR